MARAVNRIILVAVLFIAAWSDASVYAAVPGSSDSSAAVPLRGAQPVLQEKVIKDSSLSTPQEGSVEAFFQVDQSKKNSRQVLLMQSGTVTPTGDSTSKWRTHGYSRFLWHVLDNAGIPMFWGQDTSYIDPSLKETYLISAPKLPCERDVNVEIKESMTSPTQPASAPVTTNAPALLQKIPESELEGVPLPTPRDDTNVSKP